jgi:serine/threonine protein kinase
MTNETDLKQIGPYEIIDQVGTGGMATVYKAYQPRLDRYVAVKVMHQMFLQDPNFRARFEREARIVGGLDHPNIVPIYDYAELKGQPYLVMKYIEGRTLKDYMREEPLNLEEIRYVMQSVCDALTYAHKSGVFHRDMKPSNIIIDSSGTPYLTDFGLARIAKQGESTLSVDTMLGTPHYISPEQAQGGDIDARADVYSTGVILYELVAGRLPFTGDSPFAIIHKQIYAAPPPPSQLNPDIPPEIDTVLLTALAKTPAERYKTPNDLILAFEKASKQTGMRSLDASRVTRAAQLGELISHQTPGGGHYSTVSRGSSLTTSKRGKKAVIVPVLPPGYDHPKRNLADWFEIVIQRLREAFADIRDQLQDRDIRNRISETVGEIETSVKGAIPAENSKRKAKSAKVASDRYNPTIQPAARPQQSVQYNDERDMDEALIRRRARQRLAMRTGFFVHAGIYVLVIGSLFIGGNAMQAGLTEWVNNGTFITDLEFTGNPEALRAAITPLFDLPLPLIIALLWGTGLVGHFIKMIDYSAPFRVEQRRNKLDEELTLLHGEDWSYYVSGRTYRQVRKGVEKRAKRRIDLITHIVSTGLLLVFGMITIPTIQDTVMQIYEIENGTPMNFTADWLPIFFSIVLIPLLMHMIIYAVLNLFGGNSELAVEREIARERAYAPPSSKRKNTLQDDTLDEAPVRLTEDGELTQSYVEEITTKRKP